MCDKPYGADDVQVICIVLKSRLAKCADVLQFTTNSWSYIGHFSIDTFTDFLRSMRNLPL